MKVSSDHENRINRAVNFINENPSESLSLERLAAIANYSPFHFQRLFRTVVGETPKQYVLRIRLETAAHAMVMLQHRSITAIALDHGFSSSATFSRAFSTYFGISPQELKRIPHEKRYKMYRQGKLGRHVLDTDRYFSNEEDDGVYPQVQVVRTKAIRGIFVSTSLDDERLIRAA